MVNSFDLLGMIEPMCIGAVLGLDPVFCKKPIGHEFQKDQIMSYLSTLGKNFDESHFLAFLSQHQFDFEFLFDTFGCYKQFGYPTIEIEKGLIKLRDIAKEDKEIDDDTCKEMERVMKYDLMCTM